MADITLEAGWKSRLAPVLASEGMARLRQFLVEEKQAGKVIYPKGCHYFQAMNLTPFEAVKVVILGQDPYHGPGQAHGLSFSVQPGIAVPPSLVNIYKELESDLGTAPVQHGCLVPWARQGVLLLNTVLTVEANKAASHRGQGWEAFTDAIIEQLNDHREQLVFILWGSHAREKGRCIDTGRHCVIESAHPSPLSAYRGFWGSRPFSRANAFLAEHGQQPIDWQLEPAPVTADLAAAV